MAEPGPGTTRHGAARRAARIAALLLGSVWLVPVSCAVGGVIGTRLVAAYDARDVRDGDPLHNLFGFVTEGGGDGAPFVFHRLAHAERLLAQVRDADPELRDAPQAALWQAAGYRFRMQRPEGRLETRDAIVTYRVIGKEGDAQEIEVVEAYRDGDNTIWSRYLATRDGITPLTSRMLYFGYGMAALPFAFAFAIAVYALGRLLRRRVATR